MCIRDSHWMERSLHSLERAQRFEDAYALRMELADWLLEDQNREPRGNLTVETLLREQHLHDDLLILD